MIVEYKRMYHIDPMFIEGRLCVFRTGKEIFAFKQYTFDTLMARIERELPARNVVFKRVPVIPVDFLSSPPANKQGADDSNSGSASG